MGKSREGKKLTVGLCVGVLRSLRYYGYGKVARMAANYCHVLSGSKTLKAVDCMTLDEFNRRR